MLYNIFSKWPTASLFLDIMTAMEFNTEEAQGMWHHGPMSTFNWAYCWYFWLCFSNSRKCQFYLHTSGLLWVSQKCGIDLINNGLNQLDIYDAKRCFSSPTSELLGRNLIDIHIAEHLKVRERLSTVLITPPITESIFLLAVPTLQLRGSVIYQV